ncbi:hypothetical protein MHSWG343_00480 [Candidatus Mycoplasma haematohominis]|uniref:Uncharacterized protein n=1 Tax=Candidatus Mycoplasma haematohominis TaxID=1494318 RepID=A0A478FST9_9MOLU|nr:hypothetical protein MHSWG343_00480 [Candidatus Mycoplasma haemohominis]
MASPVAVGGGVLGAAAVGVGGAYLAGAFEGLGSSEVEIEQKIVLLSQNSEFKTEYGTDGKIGKDYGNYLVAPFGDTSASKDGQIKENNRKWWEQSYENWKRDSENSSQTLSEEFKDTSKVSKAFSDSTDVSDSSTALNRVCKSIYVKEKSTITLNTGSTGNEVKLKRDLFKYCSILGEVKTISEAEEIYNTDTKGKEDANAKKFIAVNGNDKFWAKRNEEFNDISNAGEKSRSKSTVTTSKFKTGLEGNLKSSVKDICQEAYKSSKDNQIDYPTAEVDIFCTL